MTDEAKTFKPQRGETPQKYCNSCAHCSLAYCKVHQRRVEEDFNRCFYHSYYQPTTQIFHVPPNLDKIMQAEKLVNDKKVISWKAQHNKLMDEIRAEIKLSKNLGDVT